MRRKFTIRNLYDRLRIITTRVATVTPKLPNSLSSPRTKNGGVDPKNHLISHFYPPISTFNEALELRHKLIIGIKVTALGNPQKLVGEKKSDLQVRVVGVE